MEDVLQWLPDRSADQISYQRYLDRFGSDDFFMVRWDGCRVQDARCDQLVETLLRLDRRSLIQSALSGRDLIRDRPSPQIQSPVQVAKRFEGIFFGPDIRDTCIVIGLSSLGMANRSDAIELVNLAADQVDGLGSEALLMAGYPAVACAADELIGRSLLYGFVPCCLLSIVAAAIFIRNLKLALAILFIAALASGLCIASVTLSGSKWGAMSTVIPALTYVLTVSGSLHLLNYAFRDVDDNNDAGPNQQYQTYRRSLAFGWKPCLISSITTGAGVLALTTSSFPAIRQFGLYCAIGTAISLVCQLLLTPVFLQILGGDHRSSLPKNRWFDVHYAFVSRWYRWLFGLFAVGACFLLTGLPRLQSNLEVERFFTEGSGIMNAVADVEATIGPIEQTELMIEFPSTDAARFVERIEFIRSLQDQLDAEPSINRTISAATWVPKEPSRRGIGGVARRVAYKKRLAEIRSDLEKTRYLMTDETVEVWRISIRFPFMEPTDFAALNQEVVDAFQQHISEYPASLPTPKLTHTGVSLLYHLGQNELLSDLMGNFATAFGIISAILFLVLRSWSLGLIALLPNAFPALALFGVLGWSGGMIDLSIAIMACVALGIAVDDTTHFIVMHDELKRQRKDPPTGTNSLQRTIRRCGPAMIATTAIICAGFTAFLFGEIAIMVRFAISMIATLSVALLCDLLLLPSLLCVAHNDSQTKE